MALPDIYFLPEWGRLYEEHQGGEAAVFEFRNELGHVHYQFIKKQIAEKIEGQVYCDTVTPYGYCGPVVLDCREGCRDELLNLYDEAFQEHCEENRIVAEYVQFSPWLENHMDFKDCYELVQTNYTVGIDLTVEDFFMDEFESRTRRNIRKAVKNGVTLEYDYSGESLADFDRLYKIMAEKNRITDYYMFDEDFFRKSFELLEGRVFIINAMFEGECISSSMFLHHGDFMHYHLSANDPEYYPLHANSLIIKGACDWGVEHGKKQLHLGGAGSEKLFEFKNQFTRSGQYGRYAGKKIRDRSAYDKLVEQRIQKGEIANIGYFPLYRG